METLETAKSKLFGVKKRGDNYMANCPCHADGTQSLSLKEVDGKLLAYCHAGCKFEDIIEALKTNNIPQPPPARHHKKSSGSSSNGSKSKVTDTYYYHDEDGQVVYKVLRQDSKDFPQLKPDGSPIGDTRKVLYNLPKVLKSDFVFITEGEKDANTLIELGFVATTVSGGATAKNWKPHFNDWMKEKGVILIPDNDEPGKKFMFHIENELSDVAKVKIITLPGLENKEDITDWISQGHTSEELLEIIKNTPKSHTTQHIDENVTTLQTLQHTFPEGGRIKFGTILPFYNDNLPDFPLDSLPDVLKEYVEQYSVSSQTPIDMSALPILSVIATSVQGKFLLEINSDYKEELAAWTIISLKSGKRKTSTHEAVTAPIRQYQLSKELEMFDDVSKSQATYDSLKSEYESAKHKRGTKSVPYSSDERRDDMIKIKIKMGKHVHINNPRYIVSDITQEKLAALLKKHDESLGVFSDEGEALAIMAGRYTNKANIELYLKSWSGSPHDHDRVNKTIRLVRPLVSFCLFTQPSVLSEMGSEQQFIGKGLLARFWYSTPKTYGIRNTNPPTMDERVKNNYKQLITNLLEIEPLKDEYNRINPYKIKLSDEAFEAYQEYAKKIEPMLQPYTELDGMCDWGDKLVGSMLRISALLDLAEHNNNIITTPPAHFLSIEWLNKAINIANYLKEHALYTLTTMRQDPEIDRAEYLKCSLLRLGKEKISVNDLFQSSRGKSLFNGLVESMQPALLLLERHNYIHLEAQESSGGRKKSPIIHVNPELFKKFNPTHSPESMLKSLKSSDINDKTCRNIVKKRKLPHSDTTDNPCGHTEWGNDGICQVCGATWNNPDIKTTKPHVEQEAPSIGDDDAPTEEILEAEEQLLTN